MVFLSTTRRCNASCRFCYRHGRTIPGGDMTPEVFERILRENDADTYALCLHGEPLVDPLIVARVALTRALRPAAVIYLHTNAQALTPTMSTLLADAGLNYAIASVYGLGAKHDELQPGTNFNVIVRNIEAAKGVLPIWMLSNTVEGNEAAHTEAQFWTARGAAGVITSPGYDWGDGLRSTLRSFDPSFCPLVGGVRLFDVDGTYLSCCYDWAVTNKLGNIRDLTWPQMRERLRTADLPFCEGCSMRGYFDAWRQS